MGWGTDFTANIYLDRMTFKTIQEVKNKIEENEKYINDAKQKIKNPIYFFFPNHIIIISYIT